MQLLCWTPCVLFILSSDVWHLTPGADLATLFIGRGQTQLCELRCHKSRRDYPENLQNLDVRWCVLCHRAAKIRNPFDNNEQLQQVVFTNGAQLSYEFAIVVTVHCARSSSRRFYARNLSSIRSVRSAIPKSERTGRRLPIIARSRRLKPTTSCRKGKSWLREEYRPVACIV